jgi:pilus assembly protein CpaF
VFSSKNSRDKQSAKFGVVDLKRATQIIQEIVQEPEAIGEERAAKNKQILEEAMAGVPGANAQVQTIIADLLEEYGVDVEEMDRSQVAYEIYKYAWGLGPIEEIYHDADVNEIRVNSYSKVYVLRKVKSGKMSGIAFRDDEHIRNIITRLTLHDQGVALNRSNPTIESMRKDGTRITATCPPVTKNTTFVLRKPYPHLITPDEMILLGTMNSEMWDVLKILIRGRANILIAGGVGSGKTTLLRTMVAEADPLARIVVLETDTELMLENAFTDRDIVEFEEHKELGRYLKDLFATSLRYSPVMIIVGEFRGTGEANEAVRACIRGHNSMATAHFSTPRGAIEGTAKLLIEEGLSVSLTQAISDVATAFDIVVQMFGDPSRGVIMIESVTEVVVDQDRAGYRDIICWVPRGKDYLDGDWELTRGLSGALVKKLCKYISKDELKGAGLV